MADRHKNSRRKPQGTGKPTPGKDRTAHDRARGVKTGKNATLAHLTKDPLTSDEFEAALQLMHDESDRGAAIMGAALVEEVLISALKYSLKEPDNVDALFYDMGAPFGTLRAKTVAAYALGICSETTAEDIDVIRTVRNQFSHSLRPLDFRHPEIAAYCERLAHRVKEEEFALYEEEPDKTRARFIWEMATTELWLVVHKFVREALDRKLSSKKGLSGLFGAITALGEGGDKDATNDIATD